MISEDERLTAEHEAIWRDVAETAGEFREIALNKANDPFAAPEYVLPARAWLRVKDGAITTPEAAERRKMTDEEAAALLLLVQGGWLKLELT